MGPSLSGDTSDINTCAGPCLTVEPRGRSRRGGGCGAPRADRCHSSDWIVTTTGRSISGLAARSVRILIELLISPGEICRAV